MAAYLVRRLLLIIPTLLGVMLLSFIIIQFAPGGPIERIVAEMRGAEGTGASRIGGSSSDIGRIGSQVGGGETGARYGARGLDADLIRDLERQFGFDRPPVERFLLMIKRYLTFDFGESYFRKVSVVQLIGEKLPVSISLGLWSTLITYGIAIPLGIRKAVQHGSPVDVWTSTAIIIGFAIPSFLFAVFLIVLFAGGSFFDWFPLKGLTSDNWQQLSWPSRIVDYFWHLALPLTAIVISSLATITFLTKNSFLDEIKKQYVTTARAKGLTERRVLYGHVFRNAMLLVISGFPAVFISSFFTNALLIETIFSLDGLGRLSFESLQARDYAVVFATLYIFSGLGLLMNLLSDVIYTWVDPRIDFESREV
jgi:microcin C transport system permease protein